MGKLTQEEISCLVHWYGTDFSRSWSKFLEDRRDEFEDVVKAGTSFCITPDSPLDLFWLTSAIKIQNTGGVAAIAQNDGEDSRVLQFSDACPFA